MSDSASLVDSPLELIAGQIAERGFAVVHSTVLGGAIVLAYDPEDIPEAVALKYVSYTMGEVRELQRRGISPDGLRRVHLAKKVFRVGTAVARVVPGDPWDTVIAEGVDSAHLKEVLADWDRIRGAKSTVH